jgi:hypothetical protein
VTHQTAKAGLELALLDLIERNNFQNTVGEDVEMKVLK